MECPSIAARNILLKAKSQHKPKNRVEKWKAAKKPKHLGKTWLWHHHGPRWPLAEAALPPCSTAFWYTFWSASFACVGSFLTSFAIFFDPLIPQKHLLILWFTLVSLNSKKKTLKTRDGSYTQTRPTRPEPAPIITRMDDKNGDQTGMGRVHRKRVRVRVWSSPAPYPPRTRTHIPEFS